jgi:hypothetical protein
VLDSARSAKRRAVKRDVQVETEQDARLTVDVIADPLSEQEILLVFQEAPVGARAPDEDEADDQNVDGYSQDDRIKQLEDELADNGGGTGDIERGAEEFQRRNDVDERGTPIGERGTRDGQ